ncbi:hypothetical protein ALC62_00203 [Cyphomyrmex costatus]|uniref:Uncharacterized protein n=1 Tax=Cyphomyrmex costatus TaxID=456900 RepID=A0A195D7B4_9HYME|nr:hypothetical protein ALC62_00203 [Cyphomyrmex costatus]
MQRFATTCVSDSTLPDVFNGDREIETRASAHRKRAAEEERVHHRRYVFEGWKPMGRQVVSLRTGTAGRVGNLTTIRVREYEECITGTGASKAAFPGYDARCVRREQWEMNLSLISCMEILSCDAATRSQNAKGMNK